MNDSTKAEEKLDWMTKSRDSSMVANGQLRDCLVKLREDYKLLESNAYELQGDCRDQQTQIAELEGCTKLEQMTNDRDKAFEAVVDLGEQLNDAKAELAKPPATRAADRIVELGQEVDELRRQLTAAKELDKRGGPTIEKAALRKALNPRRGFIF